MNVSTHAIGKERRTRQRSELYKNAVIRLTDGMFVDCIVADISETGATLLLTNPKVIPIRFELCCSDDDISIDCTVRRILGPRIAVKFARPLQTIPCT